MSHPGDRLAQAKYEAKQARVRLVATAGALQDRLHPAHLASNAWQGVREKSGELAEDAIQAVRERPVKASGVVAGIALFLARDSIRSLVSSLLNRENEQDEDDDVAAPAAKRRKKQGANA